MSARLTNATVTFTSRATSKVHDMEGSEHVDILAGNKLCGHFGMSLQDFNLTFLAYQNCVWTLYDMIVICLMRSRARFRPGFRYRRWKDI